MSFTVSQPAQIAALLTGSDGWAACQTFHASAVRTGAVIRLAAFVSVVWRLLGTVAHWPAANQFKHDKSGRGNATINAGSSDTFCSHCGSPEPASCGFGSVLFPHWAWPSEWLEADVFRGLLFCQLLIRGGIGLFFPAFVIVRLHTQLRAVIAVSW